MTKKEAYTHLQDFNNPYFKILPCQAGDREGFTIQSTIEPAYSINTIFEGIHFIIQTSKFYFIIMCYGQVRAIHKTLNFYTLYLPQMDARTIIANPYTDPDSGSERKFAWHDNRLSFGVDYRSYIPYFLAYNRCFFLGNSRLKISQESFTYEKKIIPYRHITGIGFTSEKMDVAIRSGQLLSLPYAPLPTAKPSAPDDTPLHPD